MRIIALAFSLAAAAPLMAQATDPAQVQGRVGQRESNQRDRIDQGIANGEITHKEARKLDHQQNKIAAKEDRMRDKHGGTLTHHERKVLAKDQKQASKHIRHATDNDHVQ